MSSNRNSSPAWVAPLGSSLTLTIVLLASLAPQPAGAGGGPPDSGAARSNSAMRSAASGEVVLGWTLWFDQAGPGLMPLPCWPAGDAPLAAVRGDAPDASRPAPELRSCPTRGP